MPLAQSAKSRGIRVYHLNIGDPDIETPPVMLDILKRWKTSPIGYGLSQGEPEFIDALQLYYRSIGFGFLHTDNIQVTVGGSEAIFMAMFGVGQPGDEIVVFEPFYTNYNSYAAISGIRLVPIRTHIRDGFHIPDTRTIEKSITKKTRAILYCSPNNPTGTVYTQKEVEQLVGIAQKHGLFLLSDEVYREFTYDGKKHVSLLSYMRDIPEQAIVLDSMSKRYSLCGARLGALLSLNSQIMEGVLRIGQGRLSAGVVDQAMAAQLIRLKPSYYASIRREYEKRRDLLYSGLSAIPGVVIPKPEGAFYTIVGLPISDAEDFCRFLLTDFHDRGETVMLAPAAGFYASKGSGANEVRIAYVLNCEKLTRCIEILRKALKQYQRKHS